MLFSSYFPHALYSVAITSISIHLVSHRKAASDDRARVQAQKSILESIATQLKSEQPISGDELERLKRLARASKDVEAPKGDVAGKEVIGWKEVIFGRKRSENAEVMSKWDRKDLDTGVSPLRWC